MFSKTFSRSYKQRVSFTVKVLIETITLLLLNVASNHQEFHNDQNFSPQMRFNE
jgi:hypothetical protein